MITPIDFDHQSFLGDTIDEIASTKLRSCDNKMIVNKQLHVEVYEVASNYDYIKTEEFDLSSLNFMPTYLLQNLKLALTALKYLNIDISLELFKDVQLFGRCQKIKDNITIDVGHNPLAATVIKDEFIKNKQKVSLVYNCFKDKDYKKVLEILKPIINEVLIIKVQDNREVLKSDLVRVCEELELNVNDFKDIKKDSNYLVFGSFSVVEEFLKFIKIEGVSKK